MASAEQKKRFGELLRHALWYPPDPELRELSRSRPGVDQGWLADQLRRPGRRTSQSTVSAWVNARSAPAPATVFEIERILGCEPGYLASALGYGPPV